MGGPNEQQGQEQELEAEVQELESREFPPWFDRALNKIEFFGTPRFILDGGPSFQRTKTTGTLIEETSTTVEFDNAGSISAAFLHNGADSPEPWDYIFYDKVEVIMAGAPNVELDNPDFAIEEVYRDNQFFLTFDATTWDPNEVLRNPAFHPSRTETDLGSTFNNALRAPVVLNAGVEMPLMTVKDRLDRETVGVNASAQGSAEFKADGETNLTGNVRADMDVTLYPNAHPHARGVTLSGGTLYGATYPGQPTGWHATTAIQVPLGDRARFNGEAVFNTDGAVSLDKLGANVTMDIGRSGRLHGVLGVEYWPGWEDETLSSELLSEEELRGGILVSFGGDPTGYTEEYGNIWNSFLLSQPMFVGNTVTTTQVRQQAETNLDDILRVKIGATYDLAENNKIDFSRCPKM